MGRKLNIIYEIQHKLAAYRENGCVGVFGVVSAALELKIGDFMSKSI